MSDADVRRPIAAWLWGGGLLALSAVLPALVPNAYGTPVVYWTSRVLFAAASCVFAFGIRREGSIVARRSLGVTALLVLAFAPSVIVLLTPAAVMPDSSGLPENLWVIQLMGTVGMAVAAAAALVAVAEIARARVVPDPWRWAPAWGLAAVVAFEVIAQVVVVAAGAAALAEFATLLAISGAVAGTLVPLALGVLAMVLGARGRSVAPAQVYPPA